MTSNIDRFKNDLAKLIKLGNKLHMSMQLACFPDQIKSELKKQLKEKTDEFIKNLPSFETEYQRWYSEALALLRQILPDRVADFCRHYEKPKTRKDITYDNYRIEDYLQGLNVTRGVYKEKVVSQDAAIPHFRQQLAIVEAAQGPCRIAHDHDLIATVQERRRALPERLHAHVAASGKQYQGKQGPEAQATHALGVRAVVTPGPSGALLLVRG